MRMIEYKNEWNRNIQTISHLLFVSFEECEGEKEQGRDVQSLYYRIVVERELKDHDIL